MYISDVLTLMIQKLTQYPNMTFQWVETVFLERWFRDITDAQKEKVNIITVKLGSVEECSIVGNGRVYVKIFLEQDTNFLHLASIN